MSSNLRPLAVLTALLSLAGCVTPVVPPEPPGPIYIAIPGSFTQPERRDLPERPVPGVGGGDSIQNLPSQTSMLMPSPASIDLDAVDIGPPPADYKEQIRSFMTPRLRDPSNVRFRFGQSPHKGTRTAGDGLKVSWFVVAAINEPNARGEYTGEDRYYFFFDNGAIVDYKNFDADLRRLSN